MWVIQFWRSELNKNLPLSLLLFYTEKEALQFYVDLRPLLLISDLYS